MMARSPWQRMGSRRMGMHSQDYTGLPSTCVYAAGTSPASAGELHLRFGKTPSFRNTSLFPRVHVRGAHVTQVDGGRNVSVRPRGSNECSSLKSNVRLSEDRPASRWSKEARPPLMNSDSLFFLSSQTDSEIYRIGPNIRRP